MIARTLELDEPLGGNRIHNGPEVGYIAGSVTVPLSDAAADFMRSRKRFSVGDFCATTRRKHGRVYFTIAEVQDNGRDIYLTSDDAVWNDGGGRADFLGSGRYACEIGDVERRLTSEQWDFLRSAGFPLGIVGALREAGLYYEAPPPVATRMDLEISRVDGAGGAARYAARVLDDRFETILFPAPHDGRRRMGVTWQVRPKAPTLRYLADKLTNAPHDLEIVHAAVERYLTTDVDDVEDLQEDDEERA